MDDAPLPHRGIGIEHGVGKDLSFLADPAAGHDAGARVDRGPGADFHVGTDRGKRMDIDIASQPRGGVDGSLWTHARAGLGPRRPEVGQCGRKGGMHVGHLDCGSVERARSSRHDRGGRPALGEQVQLVGSIDESDLIRAGQEERRGAG